MMAMLPSVSEAETFQNAFFSTHLNFNRKSPPCSNPHGGLFPVYKYIGELL